MSRLNIGGLAFAMLIALAGVWLYNRFSGKSIATLGVPVKTA